MSNLNKYNIITFLIISSYIPILYFTSNGFYSDDYQLIIGSKIFLKIKDFLPSYEDFFYVRIDGHFAPVHNFYNFFLPANFIITKFYIVLSGLLSVAVIYVILNNLFRSSNIALIASLLYALNYSIQIKSYAWISFHSHITNSLTGFLSLLFVIFYIRKRINLYLIIYFLLGLLSVLNHETGLYYVLLSLFVYVFYSKTLSKQSLPAINIVSRSIIIISPILIYILFTLYLSGRPLPLLQDRADPSKQPKIAFNAQTFYDEYRSRKAPRNVYGYSVRTVENILGSLNISSLEYVIRYYLEGKKALIKQNMGKYLFPIGALSLAILLAFGFSLLMKLRRLKYSHEEKYAFLLYLFTLGIYSIVFFRKDLNQPLAFASALVLSILINKLYENGAKQFASLILILFTIPSILYISTGFEKVYEMRHRSYIRDMSQNFYKAAYAKRLDQGINYFLDYINLYYYTNFEEHKDYLRKKYGKMKYKEFEETFSKEEATLAMKAYCAMGKYKDKKVKLQIDEETISWKCSIK
jgi:hypothetical protein